MNTLFKGITAILPDEESGFSAKVCDIAVSDSVISYIGDDAVKNGFVPDRTIDGRDKLITAGLVNSHTHSYMSLFRNSAAFGKIAVKHSNCITVRCVLAQNRYTGYIGCNSAVCSCQRQVNYRTLAVFTHFFHR